MQSPGTGGGITAQAPNTGKSALGWIFSAAVVIVIYQQFPPLRPFLTGTILLIVLGLALRFEGPISESFNSIF